MSTRLERPAWNLLTGTLTKYVLLAVNIGIGIFLMPFTLHHLGKAEYGLWMLAASLTAYLQLLDLGYGSGLVRQVTQADARGDEEAVNVILSTFAVVYSAIGMVALGGVAALVALIVPRFPNLSSEDIRTAQWVVAILGVRFAIAFPMSIFGAVTTARQRFALTGWIAILVALLQAAATVLVLRAGYGLTVLVSVTTAVGIASYVAYAVAARLTFPGLRLSLGRFSTRQVREVTAFSLYMFLISVSLHIGINVDNLIVGAYLGTSAIAVYTVAVRLAEYQRQLCGQFTGFLFPLVVRFDATHNADALRSTLLDGTRIALGLVGGLTVCMMAFGRPLVDIWMGPGFGDSLMPLYVLLLFGFAAVAQGPTGSILLATGHHRLVAAASLLDIALNVALSVALVSRYGLTGVAIGTAAPYIALNLGVLLPIACRSVAVPLRSFAGVATPMLIGIVPAAATAVLIRVVTVPASLSALVTQAGLVAAIYVVSFYAGLRTDDRVRYLESIRRLAVGITAPRVATS